jgi:hypothetical protein
MNKLIPVTCYIPIDVKERLPEKQGLYHIISDGENLYCHFLDGIFFEINPTDEIENVSHWLEKKEDTLVISVKDIEKIMHEIYTIGHTAVCANLKEYFKEKEEYINSLFNK